MVRSTSSQARHLCQDPSGGLSDSEVRSLVGGHPRLTVPQPGPSRHWKSQTRRRFALLENLSLSQRLHFTCGCILAEALEAQRSNPSRQASLTTSLHFCSTGPPHGRRGLPWQARSGLTWSLAHACVQSLMYPVLSLVHALTHSLCIHSFSCSLINYSIFLLSASLMPDFVLHTETKSLSRRLHFWKEKTNNTHTDKTSKISLLGRQHNRMTW